MTTWKKLKKIFPGDAEPDLRIGEILMMLGKGAFLFFTSFKIFLKYKTTFGKYCEKSAEALYPLNDAIRKDPRHVEVRRVRGMLFFLEGNYEAAAEDFAVAVEFENDERKSAGSLVLPIIYYSKIKRNLLF